MKMINSVTKVQWIAILFFAIFISTMILDIDVSLKSSVQNVFKQDQGSLGERVIPSEGVVLPVRWGFLGRQMIETGVINQDKLESLYTQRGGLTESELSLLNDTENDRITINPQNSGFLLNLFWALGLSNKNEILQDGPMQDPQYGGADRFASTGGWTLSKGNVMDHYSAHQFITLTSDQQEMVERISKGIYRPCCGNSTYFPDCNHGMAMLGLIELMASQDLTEEEIYSVALQVNSYWFPDTYLTISKYFQERGVEWEDVSPKDVLGASYSSGNGYRRILEEVEPVQFQGGGGCSV